jgi:hypothetical protein
MTTITFPSSPTVGQTYTSDTKVWQWDGKRWMPIGTILSGTAAANAVNTAAIQDAAVTTVKIADGNITTAKIANGITMSNVTLSGTTTISNATLSGTTTISNATLSGTTTISNATLSGTTTMGGIANIKVTGGSANQVIITDGTGNLTFSNTIGNLTVSNAAIFNSTSTFSGLVTVTQSAEVLVTKTGATGTIAHDLTTATTFYHTSPAANFTANFTNVSTTDARVLVAALVITQGATPYVPIALQIDGSAQTVKWLTSTSPSGTASKIDIISYSFIRTGAAWVVLGQYSNYG